MKYNNSISIKIASKCMTEIFHGITNVGKGLLKDLIEGNSNQVIIKTTFGLMRVIITPFS